MFTLVCALFWATYPIFEPPTGVCTCLGFTCFNICKVNISYTGASTCLCACVYVCMCTCAPLIVHFYGQQILHGSFLLPVCRCTFVRVHLLREHKAVVCIARHVSMSCKLLHTSTGLLPMAVSLGQNKAIQPLASLVTIIAINQQTRLSHNHYTRRQGHASVPHPKV